MKANRLIVTGVALLCVLALGAAAHRSQPATPRDSTASASPFTIASVGFMAGQWRGQIEGGLSEEQWSAPEGNNMLGMFRWLKPDGTPIMFEIMGLTQEPEGVFLRLLHLNGKLVAREEKGDAVTLRLAEAGPTRAVFKGAESEKRVAAATYERTATDVLRVTIQFVDPARPQLDFEFKRTAAK